jgi:hypothetical protein
VGGLHCWRDVRHAVALGVFVVFWLYMSMPTSSMHMLPSLPKDCGVAVTGGCVVESLPSMWLESDLSKTAARAQENQNANQRTTRQRSTTGTSRSSIFCITKLFSCIAGLLFTISYRKRLQDRHKRVATRTVHRICVHTKQLPQVPRRSSVILDPTLTLAIGKSVHAQALQERCAYRMWQA